MSESIDLGHDHWMTFFEWKPDRHLNPQYEGIPDVPRAGAVIGHLTPNGEECEGAVNFSNETMRKLRPEAALWTVEQEEPLTISPSVLCTTCGDHGFIRDGKWVPA